MQVNDFDYFLPERLIAQDPVEPRNASRLLLLGRESGAVAHSHFRRLAEYLRPSDVLVLNETKVLPARLFARKAGGASVELLLLRQSGLRSWQALVRPGRQVLPGTQLFFALPELAAHVVDFAPEGARIIEFQYEGDFFAILEKLGQMPLPPYIKKPLADQNRYQPVYAKERGSAAAPTAGLHFTQEMLFALASQGIIIAKVLLHVGLGTFRPVKAQRVEEHLMHEEFFRVDEENAGLINAAKAGGGRVIGVGTTSVRTLETVAGEDGRIHAQEGWTSKFIYPGYRFKAVDGMITNFHLPKSSLLMMVSAFAGRENVMAAYEEAIRQEYRFFSFGDAMFII
ncbi:MAG: tRNA preQ1(34) S-adenosylmethionine ribosyltransferase-isomerase QueA [Clostridiales bacterium]|nr:tRNA preQ1(34) S-adenosylmethionine ribosyltransferase-isomerase QueA [Clostridiales bacterium]